MLSAEESVSQFVLIPNALLIIPVWESNRYANESEIATPEVTYGIKNNVCNELLANLLMTDEIAAETISAIIIEIGIERNAYNNEFETAFLK